MVYVGKVGELILPILLVTHELNNLLIISGAGLAQAV
jgi:hypothetical protein